MIVNKYRNKIEEQIELKQREAEYLEVRVFYECNLMFVMKFFIIFFSI